MTVPVAVVVATRNAGKLREVQRVLAGVPARFVALAPGVALPEEGDDYAANAAAKALAAARASGGLALGDDSGIEVDALDGAPGPRSARFGPDAATRNARLLAALEGLPAARRGARFVCAVALATPEGVVATARGTCEGRILAAPRGAGGFGYDPVFEAEPGRSMAELGDAEKDAVSHRGRALRALAPALAAQLR